MLKVLNVGFLSFETDVTLADALEAVPGGGLGGAVVV